MKHALVIVVLLIAVASSSYTSNTKVKNGVRSIVANLNPSLEKGLLSNGIAKVIPVGPKGRPQLILAGTNVPIDTYFGDQPPPFDGQVVYLIPLITGFDNEGNRYDIPTRIGIKNGKMTNLGYPLFPGINVLASLTNNVLNTVSPNSQISSGVAIVIPVGPNGRPQVILPGQTTPMDTFFGENSPPHNGPVYFTTPILGFDAHGTRYNVVPRLGVDGNGKLYSLGYPLFPNIVLTPSNVPIYAGA